MASADDGGLGGVSLAEWEYAWRYADHLALGERRPDASGFDRERVKVIERKLDERWYALRQRLNRRAR
jgi:hypothetical protein